VAEGARAIEAAFDIESSLAFYDLLKLILGMPDTRSNGRVCIAAFLLLHRSMAEERLGNGQKRPPETQGGSRDLEKIGQLLGGDFTRRIEGAGIVDFGHLVIAEPENLPQYFVGVFA
jgi:hypothetical protein